MTRSVRRLGLMVDRALAGFLGIPVEQATVAAGSPADAAAVVTALWDAGAASVIVRPVGDDPLEPFARLVAELRPSDEIG